MPAGRNGAAGGVCCRMRLYGASSLRQIRDLAINVPLKLLQGAPAHDGHLNMRMPHEERDHWRIAGLRHAVMGSATRGASVPSSSRRKTHH